MILHDDLKVESSDLKLGSNVIMGPNFIPQGVELTDLVTLEPMLAFQRRSGVKNSVYLGRGATIGTGATLGDAIKVGSGAVIKPGSVVLQDVPDNAIVSGNPAIITGYTEQFETTFDTETSRLNEKENCIALGVGQVTLRQLKMVRDLRGDLSVGEVQKDIPFQIARYFLVFNVPNEKIRGEHAHYKCHQFLICVSGTCSVVVDDGKNRREIELSGPHLGLHLPPLTWGVQYKYSENAVLLVLASHLYDAHDYIRNYNDFLISVKKVFD